MRKLKEMKEEALITIANNYENIQKEGEEQQSPKRGKV
jgi:hypothetical protein